MVLENKRQKEKYGDRLKEGNPKLELNHIFVHQAKSNDEIAKYDILEENIEKFITFPKQNKTN